MVSVSVPIRGTKMNLHIAKDGASRNLYFGAEEVGTLPGKIPFTRRKYANRNSIGSPQDILLEFTEKPYFLDKLFWYAEGTVKPGNFLKGS